MKNKNIITAARMMSSAFTPFYLPIVGLMALFTFSYLSLLPIAYKMIVLSIVAFFTILLPSILIHLYRRVQGWTPIELGHKERRMVPYVISIACYITCIYIMKEMHIPYFMCSILRVALCIQIVCALTNAWWKISTHTAAIGGVAGALLAFAEIFGFNPLVWFCIVMILGGLVGSSRMILRQHSLSQVVGGFGVGFVCSFVTILI
ncbi:MAG: phosphatase PAP2 family protein [Prevotella sp.]|nr:phosphatase PAP2 family protein [Prevotella sp.]